ncbi:hypothetical protein BJ138DRAFT_1019739, partial [Hygrophoropsis aurantiaca]
AAVHGPVVAHHPSPFRAAHNMSNPSRVPFHPAPSVPPTKPSSTQPSSKASDPFYGHEQSSKLCAWFITHLFACPEYPPSSSGSNIKLPYFIVYALHTTKLHSSVTFGALVLLQRLKARFPTARGSSGHRLFVSAFMLASKVICDDTYSKKSWSIVAQGMFQLREINQMEREMCQYLEWELNVEPATLKEFEDMVRKDFAGPEPYPTYILKSTTKTTPPPTTIPFPPATTSLSAATRFPTTPPPTTIPFPPATTSDTPAPSYGQRYPSPPKPSYPPPLVSQSAYMTPPTTPDTPSPSYSASTSPASSASPPTPPGIGDLSAKIVSASSSLLVRRTQTLPVLWPTSNNPKPLFLCSPTADTNGTTSNTRCTTSCTSLAIPPTLSMKLGRSRRCRARTQSRLL